MIKKSAVTDIDLIEIARSRTIGPISAGADLAEIGPLLGMPDRWQFHKNDSFFTSWMNFGKVEIGFEAAQDIVCVSYAKFYMEGFENGLLKFTKVTKTKELRIRNNFDEKEPTLPVVAAAMREQNIDFSTEVKNFVPDETWGIMHFGDHLGYYFSCAEDAFSLEKSKLNFISLSISRAELPIRR